MKYEQLVKDIVEKVGGSENIVSVYNCATRLRFQLKDESVARTDELNAMDEVITIIQSAGQYQVVIGTHVSEVYKDLLTVANISSEVDVQSKRKPSVLNSLIDVISGIFTPFLGVLAGTGLLGALLNLLLVFDVISTDSGVYTILFATANGFLRFLPIALAITAARKFKVNEFTAAAIAMSLLHPDVGLFNAALEEAGRSFTFLGLPVIYGAGYASTVFPIIVAVYLQSFVEPFVKKITPRVLSTVGVSLLTLLIIVPLTFIAIGPLGTIIGVLLGGAFSALHDFSSILAGGVLGGLWQVLVMFGIHWGLVPIAIGNLLSGGSDFMIPLIIPAVLAQGGAAFAVSLKTKDQKLKAISASGGVAALFGITEPVIYGVTLPLKKPFIMGSIGGAIGGAVMGLFGVRIHAFSMSILSLTAFVNPHSLESFFLGGALAMFFGFITGFVLTYLIGFKDKENSTITTTPSPDINSPLTGEVIKLEDLNDEAFLVMGKGIAILPTEGRVVSPINGEVMLVFPTKHAIGLKADNGAEILIHIGLDTVTLNGEPFEVHVEVGQRVNVGDLLVEFDIEKIKEAGCETVTPIIVTNVQEFTNIIVTEESNISSKDKLFTIEK